MTDDIGFDRGLLRPVEGCAPVCYFLGAGFSAATRYRFPTSVGFLTRDFECHGPDHKRGTTLVRSSYDAGRPELKGLLDRIAEQYGTPETLNLETVMTDLYIRAFGLGEAWELRRPRVGAAQDYSVPALRRDYTALLAYIVARLQIKDTEPFSCPLTDRLVNSLKRQDSVLTLNYDTIVEAHCQEYDKGDRIRRMGSWIGPPGSTKGGIAPAMFRDFRQDERGVFAKLHGSIDWFTCPNEACPNHSYIQSMSWWYSSAYGRRGTLLDPRCQACGRAPDTVIVPPIATKPFERFPKLNVMWSQSCQALRRARRWVFIGVSFATTDVHLQGLLRGASRDTVCFGPDEADPGQICVVNKTYECAEKAARRLLGSLSPEALEGMDRHGNKVSLFESVEQYLRAVEQVDAVREDLPERELI